MDSILPNLSAWIEEWMDSPLGASVLVRRSGTKVSAMAGVEAFGTMRLGEGDTVAEALADLDARLEEFHPAATGE